MKLTVQGHEAFVYTGGKAFDPAQPTLLFLHGAMCDHGVWTLLARWFAHHGHAVLAPDLPGHMRSAGPALSSVEALAGWALALLDAAGVQRAAWVGHSMGSLAALEAAARAPERASHLVMIGTAVPMPVPQALLELSLADVDAAIDRVVGFSFGQLGPKPGYPGPGSWLRGSTRAQMQLVRRAQGDERLFHTDFSVCNAYAGGLDAAARVRCPSTMVLGANDQMTLPRGARTVSELLQAEVQTVRAGHFPMQDAPDAVLNALRSALSRHARDRA